MRLDETDARILALLQKNARHSFREIAKSVEVSTPTVSSRIRIMEEAGVIVGYSAMLDINALDEIVAILLLGCKPKNIARLCKLLSNKDNVRELLVLSGSTILCKLVFEKDAGLDTFLTELEKIEEIENYDLRRVVRSEKNLPDSLIREGVGISIPCYYCGRIIRDEPVKLRMDNRIHYLCCRSCERLYVEKYERIKSKASIG